MLQRMNDFGKRENIQRLGSLTNLSTAFAAMEHGPQQEFLEKRRIVWMDGCADSNTALPLCSLPTSSIDPPNIQRPEKAVLSPAQNNADFYNLPSSSTLTVNACCTPNRRGPRSEPRKMGLSKSNRIIILLVVDTAFFFLELIVGEFSSMVEIETH